MGFSKPRTKFYNCGTVYKQAAADLLRFRVHRGNEVADFEAHAAEHFGCRYAIATPLARMGIYLCLRYFIREGQSVLQSPYTLAEVINIAVCAGGKPLFSDVDPQNGHLDPQKLNYTDNTGAMIVTHLHGIPAEMDELLDFSQQHNIPVIEDAAQSAGTKYRGRFVGTLGDAGVLSFGMHKQLNAVYGGMVLTDNGDLAKFIQAELLKFRDIPIATLLDKLAYLLRLHALSTNPTFSWLMFPLLRYGLLNDVDWINNIVAVQPDIKLKHDIDDWYKHRFSPCQARMLPSQLRRLASDDAVRFTNARQYFVGLSQIKGLTLPRIPEHAQPTFAYFPIQVAEPQQLLRWLSFYGQDVVTQHFSNCADLECFVPFRSECPTAAKVASSLMLLPTYPSYSKQQIERNIQIIRGYFEAGQPAFDAKLSLPI